MNSNSTLLRRAAAFAAVVLVAVSPAYCQSTGSHKDTVIPLIVMNDVPLLDAIKNLARQANINYIVDPNLSFQTTDLAGNASRPKMVSERLENLTARQALDKVLTNNQATLVENPATTVARIAPAEKNVKPVDQNLVGADSAVIPLIVMDEVPLADALQNLARQAQLPVTIDSAVSTQVKVPVGNFQMPATVSIRWEKITAKQGLLALVDNFNLAMAPDPATSTTRISVKK